MHTICLGILSDRATSKLSFHEYMSCFKQTEDSEMRSLAGRLWSTLR